MTVGDIMEKMKEILTKKKEAPIIEDDAPREVRDKHLESLEREWQYYENQKRKEYLKKKLLELKKEQVKEKVFGIEPHKREETILQAQTIKEDFNIMKPSVNLMKAKRLKFR